MDERTMRLHNEKHKAAYVAGLNTAEEKLAAARASGDFGAIAALERAIAFHGCGHVNHVIFWHNMGPKAGGEQGGNLAGQIKKDFGDFAKFKDTIKNNGLTQFGSGWSWVVWDPNGQKLAAIKKPNQDSPLMEGLVPVLGVDVWEHAYYLKYQNLRANYLDAWWNTVNWKAVEAKLAAAKAGK